MTVLSSITVMVSGAVLMSTGWMHAAQPYFFADSVAKYEILPNWIVEPASWVFPAYCIVIGAALVFRLTPFVVQVLATLTFGLFVVFQAKVLILGESISCGCFGFGSKSVSLFSLSIPVVLLIANAWVLRCSVPKHESSTERTKLN